MVDAVGIDSGASLTKVAIRSGSETQHRVLPAGDVTHAEELARELAPGHRAEWFEWDALEAFPRWNQHPGLYTKLGEALPLVSTTDDRFVIMGSGDALTVRFDARALPALPAGWRRDFLVFLDGWAKDRDPNTHEALFVEPLPFHGMSGYPYRADEHFPDDEAHRAWRRDWNTRPATRWIEPVISSRSSPRAAD